MAEYGLAFRNTDGYVTDGANDEFVADDFFGGGTYPYSFANGLTGGWQASSGGLDSRDRSTGIDVRIAGLHYNRTSTEQVLFRVDVTAAEYNIRFASGDNNYGPGDSYFEFRDDATAFATIDDSGGTSSAEWYDAAGTLHAGASTWASSNARITRTFSSTILRVAMGRGGAASGNCVIAYVSVEATGGGGGGPANAGFRSLLGVGR